MYTKKHYFISPCTKAFFTLGNRSLFIVDAFAPANKPFARLASLPHTRNFLEGLGVGMVAGSVKYETKNTTNGETFCPVSACRIDPNSGNACMLSACLHCLSSWQQKQKSFDPAWTLFLRPV